MRAFVRMVTIIAMAWLIVACGGGGSSGSTANLSVTATDFKFDPQAWTVTAGQSVTVQLKNDGSIQHQWALMKAGTTVTSPFDADDEANVLFKLQAAPDETQTGTFTAPAAGTYTVVCGVPGHFEAGMLGTLTVK